MQVRLYEDGYCESEDLEMWDIMGASGMVAVCVCMIMCNHRPFRNKEKTLHLLAASALFKDLDQRFAIYLANNFVFLYSQMNLS